MPARPLPDRRPRRATATALLALGWLLVAAPAAAQYGGGMTLLVDPVQVPIDAAFDAFGYACPGGTDVTMSIDGLPGPLATTTAAGDSSYLAPAIPMPDGVVAGDSYVVRADCAAITAVFVITAVCNDGALPVDGTCTDGRTVGGQDPGTTSVTIPGGSPTSTPPGGAAGGPGGDPVTGGDPAGGNGGTGGGNPALAFTGAGRAEQALRVGVSLLAIGGVLVLVARDRRDTAAGRAGRVSPGAAGSASPAPR
jgi:hypothetical protein